MSGLTPNVDVTSIYRWVPTAQIQEDVEANQWLLVGMDADIEADPTSWANAESTRAFVLFHLTQGIEELERRYRLRDRPGAPPWPADRRVPQVDWEGIKAALPVHIWLESQGIPIFPKRDGWMAQCPLPGHQDDSPSFSIFAGGRLWKCHGCQRGGSVVDLWLHVNCETDIYRAAEALTTDARVAGMLSSGKVA